MKERKAEISNAPQGLLPITHEKAYRLSAPVQRAGAADELNRQITETKVEVKLGDLIGMAPELARKLRWSITKTRKPLNKPTKGVLMQESAFPFMQDDDLEPVLEYDALDMLELPRVDSLYIATGDDVGLKTGSIVVSDPYLQYLADLPEGKAPKQVYVARVSESLRVVFPVVAGKYRVESVTDSGSQIVSMALRTAEKLMLNWDPDVQIYMQSANGQLKKSAGLARNVPFLFGDITVYLQVHVIDQPAYKVLLGRPFEILTESTIRNKTDGSQTLTIRDPNSKKRVTMPTHVRGEFSIATQPKPVNNRATMEEVLDEDEPGQSDKGKEREQEPTDMGFHQSSRN